RFSVLFVMLIAAGLARGATVDGIQLHSSSHGTGSKTVILVHGWTCDETTWDSQLQVLSKQYSRAHTRSSGSRQERVAERRSVFDGAIRQGGRGREDRSEGGQSCARRT